MNLTKKLKRLEIKICSLARLQSKLWLNEGVFESTVQALILLIAIAMRFRYAIKSLPQHFVFLFFAIPRTWTDGVASISQLVTTLRRC